MLRLGLCWGFAAAIFIPNWYRKNDTFRSVTRETSVFEDELWFKTPQPPVAIFDHIYYESNMTLAPRAQIDHIGFPERLKLENMLGPQDRGVGRQIFGHPWDYDRMSYRSLDDYIMHKEEYMKAHIYCSGARHRKSSFVNTDTTQADNDCIRQCFEVAGQKDYEANPVDVASHAFLIYCRVPLVNLHVAQLILSNFDHGPTGTVVLPRSAFLNINKNQLVDVLLDVKFSGDVATYGYTPTGDTNAATGLVGAPDTGVAIYVDEQSGKAATSSLDDLRKLGTETDALFVPSRVRYGRQSLQSRRPIGKYRSLDYRFYDASGKGRRRPLHLKGAASHQYGMYNMNNFMWPTHTGAFVDDLLVVEMPTPAEAVVDVTSTVRRLLDSGSLEMAILSTGFITDVSPVFVMHVARDWLYYLPPHLHTCADQTSMRSCLYQKCNWCGKVATGDDWADPAWAGFANIKALGNCGVPVDVCYLRNGVPSKSFVPL